MQWMRQRANIWKELLGPSWRWLVTAPLAFSGAIAFIRDEIIVPAEPATWKLWNVIPDWRWEWYALFFLGAFKVMLIQSAYRSISRRDKEIVELHATLSGLYERVEWGLSLANSECVPRTNPFTGKIVYDYRVVLTSNVDHTVHLTLNFAELNGVNILPLFPSVADYIGGRGTLPIALPGTATTLEKAQAHVAVVALGIRYGLKVNQPIRQMKVKLAIHVDEQARAELRIIEAVRDEPYT